MTTRYNLFNSTEYSQTAMKRSQSIRRFLSALNRLLSGGVFEMALSAMQVDWSPDDLRIDDDRMILRLTVPGYRMKTLLLFSLSLMMTIGGVKAAEQQTEASLTPWGVPDLQGIWDYWTFTPLERPAVFADRADPELSDEEAAQFAQSAKEAALAADRDGPGAGDPGAYGQELWTDRARATALNQLSLIVDPEDGKIPPLTEKEKQRVAQHLADGGHPVRTRAAGFGADGPESRGLSERCILGFSTGPPVLPAGYNNNIQIVQSPGYVAIVVEMIHDVRIIPLDGRSHIPSSIRQWLGDSRGHWEGNTLVVETTNFTDKTAAFSTTGQSWGTGTNLLLTERFTRIAADKIHYEFTVENPDVFQRPFTASFPMNKTELPLYEYACHEGNYGLANILKGARAEENRQ